MHSKLFFSRSSRLLKTTTTTSRSTSAFARLQAQRNLTTTSPRHKQNLRELWGILPKSGDKMPNADPPKHEMAYFKGLATSTCAFGEFRRVLHTGLYSQLVVMEVPVGGEIGDEVHTVDQILIFTSGSGLATVAGKDQEVNAGDIVVVPAGTQHQFVTRGELPLELITVYSPAEHLPTSVHKTKEQGDKEEEDGIDEAPEWSLQSQEYNEKKGLVKESGKY